MADHWVAELFPPKFSYKTVEDLYEKDGDVAFPTFKDIEKAEYYSRVFKELENVENLAVEDSTETHNGKLDQIQQSYPNKEIMHQDLKENEEECIWSNKELRTLRKFVQKIKLQNLHLVAMLESVQSQLKESKEKERATNSCLSSLKGKWSELRKRYERVKISCKAMKSDLKEYHTKLKIVHEDLKELRTERTEILKELNDTKSDLHCEVLKREGIEDCLAKKEDEKAKALWHQEFVSNEQHQLEKSVLIKEIGLLKEQLQREKDESSLNKRALEHLRTHFANMQLDHEQTSEPLNANVISVVDIDYLPN